MMNMEFERFDIKPFGYERNTLRPYMVTYGTWEKSPIVLRYVGTHGSCVRCYANK